MYKRQVQTPCDHIFCADCLSMSLRTCAQGLDRAGRCLTCCAPLRAGDARLLREANKPLHRLLGKVAVRGGATFGGMPMHWLLRARAACKHGVHAVPVQALQWARPRGLKWNQQLSMLSLCLSLVLYFHKLQHTRARAHTHTHTHEA
mgnify:CR=1 FL=1